MWGWFWNIVGKNAVDKIKDIPMSTTLITPEQLKQIAPTLTVVRSKELSDLINELCHKYGIVEKLPFQMFLANIVQESGEFAHKEENMNYRAETIVKVWPSRFPTIGDALPYARNPQRLANKVYGGRMGNKEPNDGYQFKGAGFIGITGRELYTKYAKYIGKDVTLTSDLMRTQDRYALDSACWFFAVLKNLIPIANKNDFKAVCKGINGGYIGYAVREKYYNKVKEVLD